MRPRTSRVGPTWRQPFGVRGLILHVCGLILQMRGLVLPMRGLILQPRGEDSIAACCSHHHTVPKVDAAGEGA